MGDYRTTTGEPLPESKRDRRRRAQLWLRRGGWGLLAILIAGFVIPVRIRIAADGYITTDDYAEVRAAAPGAVAEILVPCGQLVNSGELMVRLDDGMEKAQLAMEQGAARRAEAEQARREEGPAEEGDD